MDDEPDIADASPAWTGRHVWLGSRTESVVTDFDGRLRQCRIVGQVRNEHGQEILLGEADPLLPGQEPAGLVTLRRRWSDDPWEQVDHGWLHVFVGHVGADVAARLRAPGQDVVHGGDISSAYQGEIAARLDLLPPTKEERWEDAFAVLERFVAREGHARVPAEHVEDGFNLGIWLENQRFLHTEGHLSQAQASRLEALPGWEW